MALIANNRFNAAYNWSLTRPFRIANAANWLTFCVGPVPAEADILNLTAITNTLITNAKTGTIVSNAGSSFAYTSATTVPTMYYSSALPTVKTFTATQAGTITHAVVNADGMFVVVDVGLLNSGSVVQVDTVDVSVGTVVTLQAIQFKVWG